MHHPEAVQLAIQVSNLSLQLRLPFRLHRSAASAAPRGLRRPQALRHRLLQ